MKKINRRISRNLLKPYPRVRKLSVVIVGMTFLLCIRNTNAGALAFFSLVDFNRCISMYCISQRIKYYREKKDLSQMEVAFALGIHIDNYLDFESGMQIPKYDTLIHLAHIFSIPYNSLKIGIEQEIINILSKYAINAVLGNEEVLKAYISDKLIPIEACLLFMEFYDRGKQFFETYNPKYYSDYLQNPNFLFLINLFEIYKKLDESCNQIKSKFYVKSKLDLNDCINIMDPLSISKWAIFVSMRNFLKSQQINEIINEVKEISTNINAVQFFSVKVFVPYLSMIINAAESCINTDINDFENLFLFNSFTLPYNEKVG